MLCMLCPEASASNRRSIILARKTLPHVPCRGLLYRKEFVSDYIGLDSTAAKYLGDGTSIRLVGVDYLSVGMLEDIQETHKELFKAVGGTTLSISYGLNA